MHGFSHPNIAEKLYELQYAPFSDYLWNAEFYLIQNKTWTAVFDLHFRILLQFIWRQICTWIFKIFDFENPPGTGDDLGCEAIFVVVASPGEVVGS